MKRALVLLLLSSTGYADTTQQVAKDLPVCAKDRPHCFGIQLHIAPDLFDAPFIADQLAAANLHFERLGVAFQIVGADELPASAQHIETRRDRDALSTDRLTGTVIHVFLIGKLDDVDEAGAIAHGVTWHRHDDDHKYILVSNNSKPRTLAHELGHFFGLPHSSYAISIMNKSNRKEPPPEQRTFADEEYAAMRPKLEQLVRDKVIADLPRP